MHSNDIFNKYHSSIPHGSLTDRGKKRGFSYKYQSRDPLVLGTPTKTSYERNKFNVDDITRSKEKKEVSVRDTMNIKDIEGSTPSKPKDSIKDYKTLDYSDISKEFKVNPSVSTYVKRENNKPLPTVDFDYDAMERLKKGYKEIAKEEMNVIRAIGPTAARILREAKMLRSINREKERSMEFETSSVKIEKVLDDSKKQSMLKTPSKKSLKETSKIIIVPFSAKIDSEFDSSSNTKLSSIRGELNNMKQSKVEKKEVISEVKEVKKDTQRDIDAV